MPRVNDETTVTADAAEVNGKPTPKTKPRPRSPRAAKAPAASAGRSVLYPVIEGGNCAGKDALTVAAAKQFLGWTTDAEVARTAGVLDPLLKDLDGNDVYCLNNTNNRPFDPGTARKYAGAILRGEWRLNGENVIVGRTGLVLSGQHRLVALVLAAEAWLRAAGEEKRRTRAVWPEEPTLETLFAFGVDEGKETVRTLDNVRPRVLSDVLYTEGYFGKMNRETAKRLSVVLAAAIRQFQLRSWNCDKTYKVGRTHSQDIEFIDNHRGLIRAVNHLDNEYGVRTEDRARCSGYCHMGHAAALLYLMAASDSDPEAYFRGNVRSERKLGIKTDEPGSLWEKAANFWVYLCHTEFPQFDPLRESILALCGEEGARNSPEGERIALIVKAWNRFKAGEPLDADDLALKEGVEYARDEHGLYLAVHPSLGGIDNPGGGNDKSPDEGLDEDDADEVEANIEEVRGRKRPKPEAADEDE